MISLLPLIPEIFICGSALLLLMVGAFKKGDDMSFLFKAAVVILLLAIWQLLQLVGKKYIVLNGMFISDGFAIFMKVLILSAAALVIVMSVEFEKVAFEFPILILLAVCGMMVMISANNLMSLYMGLELQSLSLYILTAMNLKSGRSSEAGLKYFMLGALASGILLYGCSLIYGFAGTTDFTELAKLSNPSVGVLVGMILIIVTLCFKVSAVPFHMWTPDVYEGAPKCVTAFFATAPKVAAIALFIRFTNQPFGGMADKWQQIIIFVSIASMLVGAFGALKQDNIKRLMAYSSIGHVGYILIGLAAGKSAGIEAILIYITIYVVMSIGTFACIILMKRRGDNVESIKDLSGLAKDRPIFSAILAVFMLSMAGIPPMAGFFGKLFIFKVALEANLYTLAVVGVLSSVVAAFYYLRIIKIMYFDSIEEMFGDVSMGFEPLDREIRREMKIILGITGLLNLLFFVFPVPLLVIARAAAGTLL